MGCKYGMCLHHFEGYDTKFMNEPIIIQGGMGAAVSDWFLAKTVSTLGQMGVVSGTALDTIFARPSATR